MKFNLRSLILGILFLLLGVVVMKWLTSKQAEPEKKAAAPLKQVATAMAKNQNLHYPIAVTGPLKALQRSELFAEVQGVFARGTRDFREGVSFQKGDVLLLVDDREARATYLAQRSQFISGVGQLLADLSLDYPQAVPAWEAYLNKLSKGNGLPEPPVVTDEKLNLFLNGRGIYGQYHNLRAALVRLDKHQIVAPYAGVLTKALVDAGTLVRPGQKLGEYIQTGTYEMEASVPTREMGQLKVGQKITLTSNEVPGTWTGEVVRFNKIVDPATQSIQVYLRVQGQDLAEGLYLSGELESQPLTNVVEIPRAVIYDNRFVYLVQDSVLVKQPIDLQRFTSTSALVGGIPEGAVIMMENMPAAYEGMKVSPLSQDKP